MVKKLMLGMAVAVLAIAAMGPPTIVPDDVQLQKAPYQVQASLVDVPTGAPTHAVLRFEGEPVVDLIAVSSGLGSWPGSARSRDASAVHARLGEPRPYPLRL